MAFIDDILARMAWLRNLLFGQPKAPRSESEPAPTQATPASVRTLSGHTQQPPRQDQHSCVYNYGPFFSKKYEAQFEALDGSFDNPDAERVVLEWLRQRSAREWNEIERDLRECDQSFSRGSKAPLTGVSTLALGSASCSHDGYRRERAVAGLETDPNEDANGFLIVRCGEWVGEVRARAAAAVLARLHAGLVDLDIWLPLLLAQHDRAVSRRASTPLPDACGRVASTALVHQLLVHRDSATRQWALKQTLARSVSVEQIRGLLAVVTDAAIARGLSAHLVDIADEHLLAELRSSRHEPVRLSAWRQSIGSAVPDDELRRGLLDTFAGVRAVAQRLAQSREEFVHDVYRDAPQTTAAERRRRLLGWNAVGGQESLAAAQAALQDRHALVRAGAITILAARLDDKADFLLPLLQETKGVEFRAVRRAILAHRIGVSEADLAQLRNGTPEERTAAWRLGHAQGRWQRLLSTLHALGDDHEPLAKVAAASVGNWQVHDLVHAGMAPPALQPLLNAGLQQAQQRGFELPVIAWVLDN